MKKIIGLLVLLFCFVPTIFASAQISITADYGLQGQGKLDKLIPVVLTIGNDGELFEGDLIAAYSNDYMYQSGQVLPLKLAPNEKITKKIYIRNYPNQLNAENQDSFLFLYEGGIENGKRYEDVVIKNNKPTMYPLEAHVFGIFSNKDLSPSMQKLRTIGNVGMVEVQTFEVDATKSITDMRDLVFLDTILLTEPLKTFDEAQQKQLIKWMEQGGQLVVSEDVSVTALKDFAALQMNEGTKEISVQQLQQLSEAGNFTKALTINNAKVLPNAINYEVNGNVIAAKRNIGNGALIQTAFSLEDATLLQADGYADLMAKLLEMKETAYSPNLETELSYLVTEVNKLFPTFEFSLWKIISVLILYILIVSSIVYVVLKKKDKREYAWVVIPAIALVFSLALFLFGARDRIAQPQIQQSAVIKVGEQSEQYFVQSLLSNRSGDYEFTLPQDVTASNYNYDYSNLRDFQKGRWSYIKEAEQGQQLVLKNVPYWDIETFIGSGPITIGQFEVELTNNNGQLVGSIRNTLDVDVVDVQIWTGKEIIPIGNMKNGEVLRIGEKIAASVLLPPAQNDYISYSTPTPETIDEQRKLRLQSFAKLVLQNEQSPVILASTDTLKFGATLTKDAKVKSNALIVQPFEASMKLKGEVVVSNEAFQTTFISDLYSGMKQPLDSNVQNLYLEMGIYDVFYELPKSFTNLPMKWSSLDYQVVDDRTTTKIYNYKTMQFEEVSANFTTNKVSDYMNQSIVKLQWNLTSAMDGTTLELPKIQLKGVIQ